MIENLPPDEGMLSEFAAYLAANPHSKLTKLVFDGKDDGDLAVDDPWGDPSLTLLVLKSKREKVANILNRVKLPSLLSAVHFIETKTLEIIWTAYEVGGDRDDMLSREFTFKYKGRDYECRFDVASEDLLTLSDLAILTRSSETNFRNLQSFRAYVRRDEDKTGQNRNFDKPRCFFVSNFDLEGDDLIDFVQHLNFYMSYYDSKTPFVLLHLNAEVSKYNLQRFAHGTFPTAIKASSLDPNLLSFWEASKSNNPMMNYIICYRIIEYAAMHFVEDEVLFKIRKILNSPHFGSNQAADIEDIAFATNVRVDEAARLKYLIRRIARPEVLWEHIDANREFFTKDVRFDGGYVMKSLINSKDQKDQFMSHGFFNLADALRKLRNALSHGRDVETAGVVTPSLRNFELLRPIGHLISFIAGQVILYKDVT